MYVASLEETVTILLMIEIKNKNNGNFVCQKLRKKGGENQGSRKFPEIPAGVIVKLNGNPGVNLKKFDTLITGYKSFLKKVILIVTLKSLKAYLVMGLKTNEKLFNI